jgi:GTP-binding protein
MSTPIVAIVGRPNVGKSTLFNKLIGQRLSIVDDSPGVTRDRIYGECEWQNKKTLLIDTGGIETKSDDIILKSMRDQANLAIDSADVIIFVTDLTTGIVAADFEVASMLQKSGNPIVLCVNKCDNVGEIPTQLYEFYNLGLGDPIPVSSVHGHGTGDLLDIVYNQLGEIDFDSTEDDSVKVAVIGKPNAGKSSLINKILGQERCIVSNVSGTTRDAIDTSIENKHGKFTFIDTAGIRRKSKINEHIEKYSIIRAKLAIQRADVCVIMIDALEGFTEQDSKVAGLAHEEGKACVVAINKWDAIEKDSNTMKKFRSNLEINLSFMSYAKFTFISALTGQRVDNLFELINEAYQSSIIRIKTGTLNELLAEATFKTPPPTDKGKRLKIYYMTQPAIKPPTFICFVNSKKLFHFSYQRYLENQLRDAFGLSGTPIRILVRERDGQKI